MERYGVPDGIDVEQMRKKHEEIFLEFDKLVNNPEFQLEVRSFAQFTGQLSTKDLERQFTV